MSFRTDVAAFAAHTERRAQALHARTVELARASIVEGSVLTGAPGQPVAEGAPPGSQVLRESWRVVVQGPLTTSIVTDVPYAPDVEDGTRNGRPMVLRSKRGGWHSLKLTVAGWSRIVAAAVRQVGG